LGVNIHRWDSFGFQNTQRYWAYGYIQPTFFELGRLAYEITKFSYAFRVYQDPETGKTYAFAIPLAETAEPQGSGKHLPFALVLVPTRELALQCAKMIRLLFAKKEGVRTAVLAGGEDMNRQVRMVSKGADIVVATPARLLDHLRRHTFKTKMLQTVILDEADVMVSMGFYEDVIRVFEQLGPHQTALFSATYPARVQSLCEQLLHDPVIIEIRKETVHTQSIQYYYRTVSPDHKLDALAGILKKEKRQVLVFVNRRRTAEFVSEKMQERKLQKKWLSKERMRLLEPHPQPFKLGQKQERLLGK
jgi:ATP-dependent RNA helicase DeaD